MDNDGDGLLDEDAEEDLDGDGYILQMRFKDPNGSYIIDPRDPTGRLMKRIDPGKGDYSVESEGIDKRLRTTPKRRSESVFVCSYPCCLLN